jgi:hypothetical protein
MFRSMNRRLTRLTPVSGVLLAFIASLSASAQQVDDRVHEPLTPTTAPASIASRLLPGATVLRIDANDVAEMGTANLIDAELPVGGGATVTVELHRETILSDDARIIVAGPGGLETPIAPTIEIWSGSVIGDSDSKVFLGISGTQAHGWIVAGGRTSFITTRTIDGVPVVVGYDQEILGALGGASIPSCAGEISPEADVAPAPTGEAGYGTRATACKAFRLAVDTDNEFVAQQANVQAATDYAVLLVAASSNIYNRELGMGFRLSYLRIWSTTDPWNSTTTSAQLTQFRSTWSSTMSTVSRASAHMLSGRALGGGIAYLRAACSNTNGYGVSANLAGSFPFPVQDNNASNWDIMVISHELGHQFGSEHTHNSCAYSPIIDGCGLSAGNSTCEQGTQDCTVGQARTATIMSYCHLCSGGMANMQMTFGPRVIARMTSYIASLTCSNTLDPPTLDSVTISPAGQLCSGIPVTLTATATGTELRYQWFRNNYKLYNATGASYTIATPLNGDRYDVIVYSACGVLSSSGTTMSQVLSVGGGAPAITQQPVATSTCPAGPAEISVAATGTTLSYRWDVRNVAATGGWQAITDGPVMIGDVQIATAANSATSTLSLTDFSGAWRTSTLVPGRAVRCTITSSCAGGASVTSTTALISLCQGDLNCDGGVDGGDIVTFFSFWENGDPAADINGDGGIDGADVATYFPIWEAGC